MKMHAKRRNSRIEAVLKNAATDFSARGGITGDGVWAAWQTNLAQAQLDMASRSASVQRVVAAYMTLGDYKSVASIKDLVLAKFSVTLDDTPYDRSRQRYFYWKHDPDNDGLDNLDEWTLAPPPGQAPTLGDLPNFLAQSLNGVANGQAPAAGSSGGCDDADCPKIATIKIDPNIVDGTVTAYPKNEQKYGEIITITAEPNPGYGFDTWNITPPGMLVWSRSGTDFSKVKFMLSDADNNGEVTISASFTYSEIQLSNATGYSLDWSPAGGAAAMSGGSNIITKKKVFDGTEYDVLQGPQGTLVQFRATSNLENLAVAKLEADSGIGGAAPCFNQRTTGTIMMRYPLWIRKSIEAHLAPEQPSDTVLLSLSGNHAYSGESDQLFRRKAIGCSDSK